MEIYLSQFLFAHPVLGPVLFIIARIIAVVIPMLPGVIVDIPAIIVLGWWQAFLLAEVAIMAGAMIAFYIARYFREPVIRHIVALEKLEEWEQKFSERQTFWILVLIRIPAFAVFDIINYAAGLTKMKPTVFFFATLIGSFPSIFLFFYLGERAFAGKFIYIVALAVLVTLWVFYKYKYQKPQK